MLRLRKILLCNCLYYGLFLFTIVVSLCRLLIPRYSNYSEASKEFVGVVVDKKEKEGYTTLSIKNHETVIGTYLGIVDVHLGDTIIIEGSFKRPSKNTTKYLFNYRDYCYRRNIFYLVDIKDYQVLKKNHSIYYFVKQKIRDRISTNAYLNVFLLGDKSYLSEEGKFSYQENGVSHLFAISGMHISLLGKMIEILLKKMKCNEYKVFHITSIFLFFYLFLVGLSPSIVRGVLFYYLFTLNKVYYFYIPKQNLFLLIVSISLLVNPFYIYETGFQYSYLISFSLLTMSQYLNSKNYFISLLKVSVLAFIVSLPITLYSFQQINLLSILYNLVFVPLISFFVFPFSLLVFLLKPLEALYNPVVSWMENGSLLLSKIGIGKIVFKRVSVIIYVVYFIFILFYLFRKKRIYLYCFGFLLMVHFLLPFVEQEDYLKMIDVGQGDAILIRSNQKVLLMDTGGLYRKGQLFYHTLYPLLKSEGIYKIHYLVLSHGDDDHMGEAAFLIKNYRVDTVYLNQGSRNSLEKEIERIHKNVSSIKEGQVIQVGDVTFIELNKEWEDENDSSSVFLMIYKDIKVLLTGDASIASEKYILDTYDLPEVGILKAGHHGSKTSTSEELLQVIQPKLVLISCGKDNKFKHPSEETIMKFNQYDIPYLRTDEVGTITVSLNHKEILIDG